MRSNSEGRKTKSGKISEYPGDWEDVNQRLAFLGEMDRQLRALRDQYEQKVAVLKQQWVEASRPLEEEKGRLEQQIECYYWAHRDEVLASGRKSIDLSFGKLGSRRSRGLVVEDSAVAQAWLRDRGQLKFLRMRTELDREALRTVLLGDSEQSITEAAELEGCPGVGVRESEEFWYEVERAKRGAMSAVESRGKRGGAIPTARSPRTRRAESRFAVASA